MYRIITFNRKEKRVQTVHIVQTEQECINGALWIMGGMEFENLTFDYYICEV